MEPRLKLPCHFKKYLWQPRTMTTQQNVFAHDGHITS